MTKSQKVLQTCEKSDKKSQNCKKTKWLTCEKCDKNSQTSENKVEESDKN